MNAGRNQTQIMQHAQENLPCCCTVSVCSFPAVWHYSVSSLSFSIVGVATGTLLPHLANRDRRLLAHKDDVDEDAEMTRLRHTVREWRADAARRGRPLRLPIMPFLLRNIWTGALLLFTILTFSTFFITTVFQVFCTTFITSSMDLI